MWGILRYCGEFLTLRYYGGCLFEEGYSIDVTPDRLIYVPKVLSVQVVPSGEVRMVPESPTDTKSPFP